jgi:hypothetical protein
MSRARDIGEAGAEADFSTAKLKDMDNKEEMSSGIPAKNAENIARTKEAMKRMSTAAATMATGPAAQVATDRAMANTMNNRARAAELTQPMVNEMTTASNAATIAGDKLAAESAQNDLGLAELTRMAKELALRENAAQSDYRLKNPSEFSRYPYGPSLGQAQAQMFLGNQGLNRTNNPATGPSTATQAPIDSSKRRRVLGTIE